jgi:hypothetical protein
MSSAPEVSLPSSSFACPIPPLEGRSRFPPGGRIDKPVKATADVVSGICDNGTVDLAPSLSPAICPALLMNRVPGSLRSWPATPAMAITAWRDRTELQQPLVDRYWCGIRPVWGKKVQQYQPQWPDLPMIGRIFVAARDGLRPFIYSALVFRI